MGFGEWIEIILFFVTASATIIGISAKYVLNLISKLEDEIDQLKRCISEEQHFFEREIKREISAIENDLMNQVSLLTEKKLENETNDRNLFYNTTIGKHKRVLDRLNIELRRLNRVLDNRWTYLNLTIINIEKHLKSTSDYQRDTSFLPTKDQTDLILVLPSPEDSF